MRGDSVRDLYAKTLALFGLGVLAGAGALVDHWPSRINLLPAESPWTVATLPEPIRADSAEVPVVPLIPAAESFRLAARPEPLPAPVAVANPAPFVPDAFDASLFATSTAMPPFESSAAPAVEGDQSEMFRERSIDTIVESLVDSEPLMPLPGPRRSGVAAVDNDDPLSSAFKKTGSSIARGGVVTGTSIANAGASIVDGFRAVSRLVKRALPVD